MKVPVYFDNHATTPVDPRVVDAMLPFFTERFGNSASKHAFGWEADSAVYEARKNVGSLIGAARQGDHLHQRRHGVGQPGHQGSGGTPPGPGRPHHHLRGGAQGRARLLQVPGGPGLSRDLPARGRPRHRGHGPAARRHRRQDAAHLHHAGQQRGGDHPAAGRDRAHCRGAAASCFTPTPPRRWARCPSTWPGGESTCSP